VGKVKEWISRLFAIPVFLFLRSGDYEQNHPRRFPQLFPKLNGNTFRNCAPGNKVEENTSRSDIMTIAARLLDVIENDILPLTERGVAAGNKVFGAAILKKSDLSLVIAETNNELENPLWHGEVHTLKRFYERSSGLNTKDLIFLSTHEPCTMCMSAITWAGFDNFYSFFSHEDSRDAFAIPHDLKILKEVFGLEPGGYRRSNAFWNSFFIEELVDTEEEPLRAELKAQVARIKARYAALSDSYQSGKTNNNIPLA
jgi:Cytosine/adenosine deaminases